MPNGSNEGQRITLELLLAGKLKPNRDIRGPNKLANIDIPYWHLLNVIVSVAFLLPFFVILSGVVSGLIWITTGLILIIFGFCSSFILLLAMLYTCFALFMDILDVFWNNRRIEILLMKEKTPNGNRHRLQLFGFLVDV